ncbi:MAG: hypothetical protein JRI25_22875 [Deltaproteobacteria bacterium]|nr:hypothetical protein [Deltaproteobacteria bacterium]
MSGRTRPLRGRRHLRTRVVEDRGDVVVLWLRSGPSNGDHGHHALVGVDPDLGTARWVTVL